MSEKITGLALGAILLAFSFPAEAQQPKKVFRIGYLSPLSESLDSTRRARFRQGLRELGYVEGKTSPSSSDWQRASAIDCLTSSKKWSV